MNKKLVQIFFRLEYSRHGEYTPIVSIYEIIGGNSDEIVYKKNNNYVYTIQKSKIDKISWHDKEMFYYYTIIDKETPIKQLIEQGKSKLKEFIQEEAKYLLSSLEKYSLENF